MNENLNQKQDAPTLSVTDVAKDLGVSRATILRWVRSGKLQGFFQIGKKFLVRREDYKQFIKGRINPNETL